MAWLLRSRLTSLVCVVALSANLLTGVVVVPAAPSAIESRTEAERSSETTSVIVYLAEQPLAKVAIRSQGKSRAAQRAELAEQSNRIARQRAQVMKVIHTFEPGAKPDHQFETVSNGFAITLKNSTLDAVRKHPSVTRVINDFEIKADLTQAVPAVGADSLWDRGLDGSGTIVAVLDTGVDYNHPDLGGGWGNKVIGGWDLINNDADPMDDGYHGTHVAGIIAADGEMKGVAPKAKLLAYKVFDASARGGYGTLLDAIDMAVDPDGDLTTTADRPEVIHHSGGAYMGPHMSPVCPEVDNAFDLGVLCTFSAGNMGSYTTYGRYTLKGFATIAAPATNPKAITVGALNGPTGGGAPDDVASFSSKGPVWQSWGIKPEITAPGTMVSARRGGGYTTMTGTSMAAPMVAASVALVRQAHPDWQVADVRAAVIGSARRIGDDRIMARGNGALAADKAVDQELLLNPDTISFGFSDQASESFIATRQVQVRNLGAAAQSVRLSIEGTPPVGARLSVTPELVDVGAGGSAEVLLTLEVDNTVCPDAPGWDEFYSLGLVATGQGQQVRAPLGFAKAGSVKPAERTFAGATHDLQWYTHYQYVGAKTNRLWTEIDTDIDWGDGSGESIVLGSGYVYSRSHYYSEFGTYVPRYRMRSMFGAWTPWADGQTIAVDNGPDLPPVTPAAPSIQSGALPGASVTANVSGHDPEYGYGGTLIVDWGDGTTSTVSVNDQWHKTYPVTHAWAQPGTYDVRVKAVDGLRQESAWSEPTQVKIHGVPAAPLASGQPAAEVGRPYSATFTNNHDEPARLEIFWGYDPAAPESERISQTGLLQPGESITLSHVYYTQVRAGFGARATCEHGILSDYGNVVWIDVCGPLTAPSFTPYAPPVPNDYTFLTVEGQPGIVLTGREVDWGDGTPVESFLNWQMPRHTYSASGDYEVRIRDIAYGCLYSPWSEAVTLHVSSPPALSTAEFMNPYGAVGKPFELPIIMSDPEYDLVGASIEWGDGMTETLPLSASGSLLVPSHAYSAPMYGYIKVTPFDATGHYGTTTWIWADINYAPAVPNPPSGPAAGLPGQSITFTHVATESADYVVDWGDGSDPTSLFIAAGGAGTFDHTWASPGRYPVMMRAFNMHGTSGWSTPSTIAINTPPATPAAPVGPQSGFTGSLYAFAASPVDADGQLLRCEFDWGDGTSTLPTLTATSGQVMMMPHVWKVAGSYQVRVRTIDSMGAESDWSAPAVITVTAPQPPATPAKPAGIPVLAPNAAGSFSARSTDPSGLRLQYVFVWGDGQQTTTGLVSSGSTATATHGFAAGTYAVKVRAINEAGLSSSLSETLTVTVSSSKLMYISAAGPMYTGVVSGTTYIYTPIYLRTQGGNPVQGATVGGTLAVPGVGNVSISGKTDSTGKVLLAYGNRKGIPRGVYTFTTSSVSLKGWTYAPQSNLVTRTTFTY